MYKSKGGNVPRHIIVKILIIPREEIILKPEGENTQVINKGKPIIISLFQNKNWEAKRP